MGDMTENDAERGDGKSSLEDKVAEEDGRIEFIDGALPDQSKDNDDGEEEDEGMEATPLKAATPLEAPPSDNTLQAQGDEGEGAGGGGGGDNARRGREWFMRDMKKSHLLWVKVIFFFQSASMVALYPYLSIHMRSLGFSIEDVAIVNTVLPVCDIVGPPIAGLLADKIGNFRFFMAFITFMNGASSLLVLLVPALQIEEVKDFCCEAMTCGAFGANSTNNGTLMDPNYLAWPSQVNLSAVECFSQGEQGSSSFNWSEASFASNLSMESLPECQMYKCLGGNSNWSLAFWSYSVIRVLMEFCRASSLMLFEGAVVVIIKEQGGDYGLQKLFGTFGTIIFAPLSGKIIDWASQGMAVENYSSVFYLYSALRILSALLILNINIEFKRPAKSIFRNVARVIFKLEVFIFLLALFFAGLVWGFLETFLFWYLEDLGASKLLMGSSLAMGTLVGLPLTILSGLIIRKIGHHYVVFMALFFYAVRLFGYSLISNPSFVLLFELLKPFCLTLLLISAMTFVKEVSPMSTVASVEGIFGSAHFGIGRGMGGFTGGYSIEAIGSRDTFRVMGGATLVCAFSYIGVFWTRRCCSKGSGEKAIDPEVLEEKPTSIIKAKKEEQSQVEPL